MRPCVGLSSALWKNGGSDPDAVWHHRSDGFRDEAGLGIGPREGVLLGANLERAITAYVCDSAATRPSSQITLGRLVIIIIVYYAIRQQTYKNILVRLKSQLDRLNLPHLPKLPILSPKVTAKHRVVMIPWDQPEEGIDCYGEKNFERKSLSITLFIVILISTMNKSHRAFWNVLLTLSKLVSKRCTSSSIEILCSSWQYNTIQYTICILLSAQSQKSCESRIAQQHHNTTANTLNGISVHKFDISTGDSNPGSFLQFRDSGLSNY